MFANIERLIKEIQDLTPAEKHELACRLDAAAVFDDDQNWFWTPEWQATEKEADEDIAAGRVHHYNSIDEMLCALHERREKAQQ